MIKILARTLIYTFCSSQILFGISPSPRLGRAAVLDFQIEDTINLNYALGEYAAKRFSIEIGKFFTLVDRNSIKLKKEELCIREPYEVSKLGYLGTELNTGTVFKGKISNTNIKSSTKGGNEAEVKVEVEMIDSISGKVIDHCFIIAKSSPGGAKDQVYQEAILHGCYEIAKKIMMQYQPSATIQNLIGNKAIVNIGSREGYKLGQELIVYRGNKFIGMAKIVLLDNLYAEIIPINGLQGLSTGDKIRAISTNLSTTPTNIPIK